ncbi:DUF1330 domain-containing protein [Streptomyces sp. KLOTTS4A1]|uniref:DUF1330 domain-containing protein n=1 Tax=Streptomyces sp. KLOTTS4A1 TaxID=3390996 RepID=UPI0039F6142F
MSAYAIARLRKASMHADIAEYIERLPATLEPYGGRFLIHFATHEVLEGSWDEDVVMIGFPGKDEARAWWDSAAYQEIAPLRRRHTEGDIILVGGVPEGYDAKQTAVAVRAALGTAQ